MSRTLSKIEQCQIEIHISINKAIYNMRKSNHAYYKKEKQSISLDSLLYGGACLCTINKQLEQHKHDMPVIMNKYTIYEIATLQYNKDNMSFEQYITLIKECEQFLIAQLKENYPEQAYNDDKRFNNTKVDNHSCCSFYVIFSE